MSKWLCPKASNGYVRKFQNGIRQSAGSAFARRWFTGSTATKHLGPVGQRPKRPVLGGQRRVVSRLGVLDLLFGILKFPLQVRPWPERIGNGADLPPFSAALIPPRSITSSAVRLMLAQRIHVEAVRALSPNRPNHSAQPPCGSLALAIVNRSPASRAAPTAC